MEEKVGFSNKLEYIELIFDPEYRNPTFVFLHEALGSINQFKSFPANLCSKLQVNGLIYNRSGHGLHAKPISARSINYLSEYTDELATFIADQLEGHAFILIGHSDGGTIALEFAARYKHLNCRGCITLAAHVMNEDVTLDGIKIAMKAYAEGKLAGLNKYHGQNTDALVKSWSNTWQSEPFKHWQIVTLLPHIIIPVLAIQGTEDQYGTNKQLLLIEENIRNSTIMELAKIGHHPHLEDEQQVINCITNWLKTTKFIVEQKPTLDL